MNGYQMESIARDRIATMTREAAQARLARSGSEPRADASTPSRRRVALVGIVAALLRPLR